MKPEHRSWRVAEIVQTSSMDCGPAALTALLRGYGISADYGRLREACQTDVDGTSIEALETVLNQVGLVAEQVMLPPDRLFTGLTPSLPAIAVTRLPDGAPHFVVVWRRLGPYCQVMDPSEGRRWLHRRQLLPKLLPHRLSVSAADWLDWARGPEGLPPLQARLRALGMSDPQVSAALSDAVTDALWFPMAVAEAALRLVEALVADRALRPGPAAVNLWTALQAQTRANEDDIYALIPAEFWSVAPDPDGAHAGERRLLLDGAVLVRIMGRQAATHREMPADLAAAMAPKGAGVWRQLWQFVRQDGLFAPLVLLTGLALALPVSVIEAVVFRMLTLGADGLALPDARQGFILGVLALMAALVALRLPLGAETLRLGRRVEMRLRAALLAKLPRLSDRFQSSRPVSDMADRAQSLHLVRQLPGMALHFVQAAATLGLTAAGLIVLDPASLWLVLGLVAASLTLPFLAAASLAEGEMAQRSKAAALAGVWFDAMRGQAAIKAHHAQSAMRLQGAAALSHWLGAARRLSDKTAMLAVLRQAVGLGLVAALVLQHLDRQGLDLLFVWWAFKLPDAGQEFAGLIRQIPVQRAVLARLFEPLSAPERQTSNAAPIPEGPIGLQISAGGVVAGGHIVLRDINVAIAPGEHVAIVGASGSGKSSLLGVFLGWHQLAEGQLTVSGTPVTQGDLGGLRSRTAWVDPSVHLWNDSLLANAGFAATDAAPQDIVAAMVAAGLHPLMAHRPGGVLGQAGDRGGLLSGGEGQRLRFARALAQPNPGLVLLDEPFRGLDRDARSALLARARAHWRRATLLWVTHDLAELASFDRVLVLKDGQIVEDGNPRHLATCDSRLARLMQADAMADDRLWGPAAWTRLWLEDGHVQHRD